MKAKSLLIVVMVAHLLVFACSSSKWTIDDRVEGFRDEIFRVYIRINLMKEAKTKEQNEIISDSIIMDHGKKRAAQLLELYIRTTMDEIDRIDKAIKAISEVLENGEITYEDCNDEYCEVFIDFDLKEISSIIGIDN